MDDTTQQNITALKAFFDEHGTWPRTRSTDKAEVLLATWLSQSRTMAKKSSIRPATRARILELDAQLPEWRVPTRLLGKAVAPTLRRTWDESLAAAAAFTARFDRFPRMTAEEPAERRLGIWLNNQRAGFAGGTNAASFTLERNDKLDVALPGWASPLDDRWAANATALTVFFDTHGRWPYAQCDDPAESRLGSWLIGQRTNEKKWERLAWLDLHAPLWRSNNAQLRVVLAA